MSTTNLGKIGFSPKEEYVNTTPYTKLDVVSYEGSSYAAKVDTTGNLPTNTTYWMQISFKGKPFTYADFTPEQLLQLKGDKGNAFTYIDFTPEQLLQLKGEKGDTGSAVASANNVPLTNTSEYTKASNVADALLETYKNFSNVVSGTRNLYNGQHTLAGYQIDGTTGELIAQTQTGIVSDWIAVKPLTTYSNTVDSVSNTYGWVKPYYYDANKVFLSSATLNFKPTFTTPTNCYFIRLLGNTAKIDPYNIQINEGSTLLPFDGYMPHVRTEEVKRALQSIYATANPVYYVSQYGLDTNDGLSEQTPKKTLTSVNNLSNCTILLKSGEEFTYNTPTMLYFQVGSNCTISSYGGTAKPIINGYIPLTLTWTLYSTNIYKASLLNQGLYTGLGGFDLCNVGQLIVDGKYNSKRVQTLATLVNDGEYFVDEATTDIYYYSTTDVSTKVFKSSSNTHGICLSGATNSSISGLEIKGFGRHGIWIKDSTYVKANNNYIHHIGGCKQSTTIPVRYGNGIEIWDTANNVLCEYNHVTDVFDAGITNQTASAKVQYNITYRKNVIERCWYCIESFDGSSSARADFKNILYEDNLIINSTEWGKSATNGYRFSAGLISGACLRASCTTPNQLIFKNNVCYLSQCYMIYAGDETGTTYDGNVFVQKTGGNVFYPTSHAISANEVSLLVADIPSTTDEYAKKSYALSLISAKKATF